MLSTPDVPGRRAREAPGDARLRETARTDVHTFFGNPAVVEARASLDRWLCVPVFRRVCPCHELQCRRMATGRQTLGDIKWFDSVTPVSCCTRIPLTEPGSVDARPPHPLAGPGSVHELPIPDVHTDVVDATAAEAEEDEVPGQQVFTGDPRTARELIGCRPRERVSRACMDGKSQPGAVEATGRFLPAISIRPAEFVERELCDALSGGRWRPYGARSAAARQRGKQQQEQEDERRALRPWQRRGRRTPRRDLRGSRPSRKRRADARGSSPAPCRTHAHGGNRAARSSPHLRQPPACPACGP